jgi:hypothetical protein
VRLKAQSGHTGRIGNNESGKSDRAQSN